MGRCIRMIIISLSLFILINQPLTYSSSSNKNNHFNNSDYNETSIFFSKHTYEGTELDPEEIMDQNQSSTSGIGVRFINESLYYCQRIRPSINILTKISLLLRSHGSFSDDDHFNISFRKHLQINLKTYSINPNTIPDNMSWIEFDFGVLPININESYYVICYLDGGSDRTFVEWFYDVNNPYDRGCPYFSKNGKEWGEFDLNNAQLDFCFQIKGYRNNPPANPMKPDGSIEGQYDKEYTYSTVSMDGEADEIYYQWDWGDGQKSDWFGPYISGIQCSAVHTWSLQGSYLIKVKSRDTWGFESDWSDELTIRMKKNRFSSLFDILVEYYR